MNIALEGLKVLDLTRLLPGAFCTQLLADYGADVLKIEQPGTGDYNRQFAPIAKKESGSFLLLNRNKRSIELAQQLCSVFGAYTGNTGAT